MNEYRFLRIYKAIAKQYANEGDVFDLYWYLQDRVADADSVVCKACGKDHLIKGRFANNLPEILHAAIAIDAVAHALHQDDSGIFLAKIFPGANKDVIRAELDKLAGTEKTSEVRKYNRGYFTTALSEDGFLFLEKQDKIVGRTTKEDIAPFIEAYKKLFKAGIVSPAEILTLYRYFPGEEKYATAAMGLQAEPVVIGGPASVEMIDREGHLITAKALDDAFRNFMDSFRTRNVNLVHSDVTVGWALPCYMASNGNIYKSGVDDKQLWLIAELRDDTKVAKKVIEDVKKGELKSYSIAGSATDTEHVTKGLQKIMQVNGLEIVEFTICQQGMNQGANFDILKSYVEDYPDLVQLLKSFPDVEIPLPEFQIYVEKSAYPKVVVKADKGNSLTDSLIVALQKVLPEDVPITVYDGSLAASPQIPVYKIRLIPAWMSRPEKGGRGEKNG